MVRLFRHHVPFAVLLLGLLDACALLGAAEAAWVVRARQVGSHAGPSLPRLPRLAIFVLCLGAAMIGTGVYTPGALHSPRQAAARLVVASWIGALAQGAIFFALPGIALWRSNLLLAILFAMPVLYDLRLLGARALGGGEAFRRRVLVLGAGSRAARLVDVCARPGAGEVVLALEERRNALPMPDLLRVRTTGLAVSDLGSFMERETGRIDLQSVNPSWLIFADGFSSGRVLSAAVKRLVDVTASLLLLLLTSPLLLVTAVAIRLQSRGPVFYRQRRVGRFNESFEIPKFRSMRTDAEGDGRAVWAAVGDPRVTRVGRLIRKLRIDELPQAWSVLKGEMSVVGPRAERPQFVEGLELELPFYAERHMVKPGITGWAQINYPNGASVEDARHKLEFDLYHAKNFSPFLDLLILLQTLRVVLWPEGAR